MTCSDTATVLTTDPTVGCHRVSHFSGQQKSRPIGPALTCGLPSGGGRI